MREASDPRNFLHQRGKPAERKYSTMNPTQGLIFSVLIACLIACSNWEMGRRLAIDVSMYSSYSKDNLPLSPLNDAQKLRYTSALATMACFVTPGCFPAAQCRHGEPKKFQRRKKWEEQSFCVDDLVRDNNENKNNVDDGCLVYSFGIHESWEWEEKVARFFPCEVHAFDPSVNHATNLAPGLTFHKLGLQATGTDMSRTHAAEYDPIDPNLLLPLNQIMEILGHQNRTIDVLTMDCEGCEWGVLKQLACSPSRDDRRIKQIVTEFHFQKSLGLETEADVIMAAEGIQCLWEERWHITSVELSGAGAKNWEYIRGIPSVLATESMLLYIAMRRFPEEEKTPADHINDLANATRLRAFPPMSDYYSKYGKDPNIWPENAREVHLKLERYASEAWVGQDKIGRKELQFDTWEHVDENAKKLLVSSS
jgi:hypothetical protein